MPPWELKKLIFDKIGYKPTEGQEPILRDEHRIKHIIGGIQSGKSTTGAAELISSPFWLGQLYWLIGADYDACRPEFGFLEQWFTKLGVVKSSRFPHRDQCILELAGGIVIETKSAKYLERIAGRPLDGIVMCEAAQMPYEVFTRSAERLSTKKGWLVMEGCLSGEALVLTSGGIKYFKALVGEKSHKLVTTVAGLAGLTQSSLAFLNGKKKTIKVNFTSGFSIEGTPGHKVIASLPDGSITWVKLQDLDEKTLVALRYGTELWGKKKWGEDLAYLAGLYIAEGCFDFNLGGKSGRIIITNGDREITDKLQVLGFRQQDKYHWRKGDKELFRTFRKLGIDFNWKAHDKRIPSGILEARREDVIAFLRGLFDGDGSATSSRIAYYSSSFELIRQLQVVLANLGVTSHITKRTCFLGRRGFPQFTLGIADPTVFVKEVGFSLRRKQEKAKTLKSPSFLRNQHRRGREFLGYPVHWLRVKSKEIGECETYDLNIPFGNAYVANGFIVHNTLETSLDWYSDLFKEFQIADNKAGGISFSLPSWTNPHAYKGGRNDPEILRLEAILGADLFSERCGGQPVKPKGLVFPEFKSTLHVGNYPIDYKEPVFVTIDPGHYPSAYAVEFIQFIGDSIYVVDEIYEQFLQHEQVALATMQRSFFNKIEEGAIDIQATQRTGQKPVYDIWRDLTKLKLDTRKIQPISDGVNTLRTYLLDPFMHGETKLHIDRSCRGLISEFGGCKTPLNPEMNPSRGAWKLRMDSKGNVLGEKFEDRNCDALKALIYGIVSKRGFTTRKRKGGVTSTWV